MPQHWFTRGASGRATTWPDQEVNAPVVWTHAVPNTCIEVGFDRQSKGKREEWFRRVKVPTELGFGLGQSRVGIRVKLELGVGSACSQSRRFALVGKRWLPSWIRDFVGEKRAKLEKRKSRMEILRLYDRFSAAKNVRKSLDYSTWQIVRMWWRTVTKLQIFPGTRAVFQAVHRLMDFDWKASTVWDVAMSVSSHSGNQFK